MGLRVPGLDTPLPHQSEEVRAVLQLERVIHRGRRRRGFLEELNLRVQHMNVENNTISTPLTMPKKSLNPLRRGASHLTSVTWSGTDASSLVRVGCGGCGMWYSSVCGLVSQRWPSFKPFTRCKQSMYLRSVIQGVARGEA